MTSFDLRKGSGRLPDRFYAYWRDHLYPQHSGEHVFRHIFATNCYHKGIDVKILSRLLGHADVNITYNIYVHLYGDGFDEMYSALVPIE